MLTECGFENYVRKYKATNDLKQHKQMIHTSTWKCKLTFEEVGTILKESLLKVGAMNVT